MGVKLNWDIDTICELINVLDEVNDCSEDIYYAMSYKDLYTDCSPNSSEASIRFANLVAKMEKDLDAAASKSSDAAAATYLESCRWGYVNYKGLGLFLEFLASNYSIGSREFLLSAASDLHKAAAQTRK